MITKETEARILKFRDDRDWCQFHNPKDLAISVSLYLVSFFPHCHHHNTFIMF